MKKNKMFQNLEQKVSEQSGKVLSDVALLNNDFASAKIQREKRKLPRISLSYEQFRLKKNGKVFSVIDLSPEGIGVKLIEKNDLLLFNLGEVIEGVLNIRGEKISVSFRVMALAPQRVGGAFSEETQKNSVLQNFFNPEWMGKQLRALPSPDARVLWFHGSSGTDLLVWRGWDGQFQKMMLSLLGNYVQWEDEDGIQTGILEREGDFNTFGKSDPISSSPQENTQVGGSYGVSGYENYFFLEDQTPDASKLTIAKNLLVSSSIPVEVKKWCIRQIEQYRQ